MLRKLRSLYRRMVQEEVVLALKTKYRRHEPFRWRLHVNRNPTQSRRLLCALTLIT